MSEDTQPRVVFGDTNIFIALLAGPRHPLHGSALSLFRRVAEGDLVVIVTPVVVAELVYVGRPLLGWSRTDAASTMVRLLQADGIRAREQETLMAALELYADHTKLDFADAYLAASALQAEQAVASFDGDLGAVAGLELVTE